jgi:hypothetical protein
MICKKKLSGRTVRNKEKKNEPRNEPGSGFPYAAAQEL